MLVITGGYFFVPWTIEFSGNLSQRTGHFHHFLGIHDHATRSHDFRMLNEFLCISKNDHDVLWFSPTFSLRRIEKTVSYLLWLNQEWQTLNHVGWDWMSEKKWFVESNSFTRKKHKNINHHQSSAPSIGLLPQSKEIFVTSKGVLGRSPAREYTLEGFPFQTSSAAWW